MMDTAYMSREGATGACLGNVKIVLRPVLTTINDAENDPQAGLILHKPDEQRCYQEAAAGPVSSLPANVTQWESPTE